MTRVVTCGWETSNIQEGGAGNINTKFAISSSVAFSGSKSLTSINNGESMMAYATGAALGNTISARFAFRTDAAPTGTPASRSIFCFSTSGGANSVFYLELNNDLTLTLKLNGSSVATSTAISANTWHIIELKLNIGTGSVDQAYFAVNGTVYLDVTNQNYGDTLYTTYCGPVSNFTNINMYWDDFKVNISTGTEETDLPNPGKLAFLLPSGDSSVGSGWTKPGGATTSLYTSVDNIPPNGVADSTSSAQAENQIRNASANTSYNATLEAPTAKGVASTDTILGAMGFAYVAAPVTTGAKSGTLSLNGSLGTGSISGTFFSGTAAGTFPTGWKMFSSGWLSAANWSGSTTSGSTANIAITSGTASRIAMCCSMYVYVEYITNVTFPLTFSADTVPNNVSGAGALRGSVVNSAGTLMYRPAIRLGHIIDGAYTSGTSALLVEPSRTNLQIQSQFGGAQNVPWSYFDATPVAASGTAPDGTNTAVFLKESSLNAYHGIDSSGSKMTVTASTVYTTSTFIKAGSRRYVWCDTYYSTGAEVFCLFDTTTNTIVQTGGGGSNYTVETYNNGWYRISYQSTAPSGATQAWIGFGVTNTSTITPFTGDGTSGAYIWGVQFEAGSFLTTYIATTTATVTRTAEAIVFTIPSGTTSITYTFDDNSSQVVSVSSGTYTIPTTLNRTKIKSISVGVVYIYRGGSTWSNIHKGPASDATIYKGARTLHP